jgi:hypothetical protein
MEKSYKFPLDRWLVAPQDWSRHNWKEKATTLVRVYKYVNYIFYVSINASYDN